jgi:hypothetical protein
VRRRRLRGTRAGCDVVPHPPAAPHATAPPPPVHPAPKTRAADSLPPRLLLFSARLAAQVGGDSGAEPPWGLRAGGCGNHDGSEGDEGCSHARRRSARGARVGRRLATLVPRVRPGRIACLVAEKSARVFGRARFGTRQTSMRGDARRTLDGLFWPANGRPILAVSYLFHCSPARFGREFLGWFCGHVDCRTDPRKGMTRRASTSNHCASSLLTSAGTRFAIMPSTGLCRVPSPLTWSCAGRPSRSVQELLSMTMRYAHLSPDVRREAVKLPRVLWVLLKWSRGGSNP